MNVRGCTVQESKRPYFTLHSISCLGAVLTNLILVHLRESVLRHIGKVYRWPDEPDELGGLGLLLPDALFAAKNSESAPTSKAIVHSSGSKGEAPDPLLSVEEDLLIAVERLLPLRDGGPTPGRVDITEPRREVCDRPWLLPTDEARLLIRTGVDPCVRLPPCVD